LEENKLSLYESETSMVVDVWAAIKPYIGKKDREGAAQFFLRTLENYIDIETMANDIAGHDGALDRALSTLYGKVEDDDDDNYNDPKGDEELFSDDYDDE